MQVPFISLAESHHTIREEFLSRVSRMIDDSAFILGAPVAEFEQQYAEMTDTAHCIGVGNGLDALKLSLLALGIGPGDEVIVPAHTFIATIFAVCDTGATPVLAEPDIHSYNITADSIKEKITTRTKAVIPVHLYGQPCDMDGILALAQTHSLYVIEDNAQAQGARYKGKVTGSFGILSATSFYPAKNLGAMGDAGAITTNDAALNRTLRLLRNVGSEAKYHHEVIGYNSRMDSIQATVLGLKLPYLTEYNHTKRHLAGRYSHQLHGIPHLILPATIDGAEHVYHQYVVRHPRRTALQQYLSAHQISTLIHYPVPAHLQPALAGLGHRRGDFPITEQICDTCFSLPIYPGMRDEQIDFVCEKIIDFEKNIPSAP